jgi:hypothetical protein
MRRRRQLSPPGKETLPRETSGPSSTWRRSKLCRPSSLTENHLLDFSNVQLTTFLPKIITNFLLQKFFLKGKQTFTLPVIPCSAKPNWPSRQKFCQAGEKKLALLWGLSYAPVIREREPISAEFGRFFAVI